MASYLYILQAYINRTYEATVVVACSVQELEDVAKKHLGPAMGRTIGVLISRKAVGATIDGYDEIKTVPSTAEIEKTAQDFIDGPPE